MGLSDIFTNLCGCGTNGAKSPPVPKNPSPDAENENARPSAIETKASENASNREIKTVETPTEIYTTKLNNELNGNV